MVAAFVRGLLRKEHTYGLRSALAENLIFEAIGAQVGAEQLFLNVSLDAAITGVIKPDARQKHLESVFARAARAHDLKLFDVYRLSHKPAAGSVSLYQLYHLMQKRGILDAMRADFAKLPSNTE